QREVKMPGGGDELGQEKPATHHHGPKEHHSTWPMSVHQATQERRRDRRHERPDREGAGGQAKRPAKLVEERRKKEGERPGDRHPDAHGHEGKRHDDQDEKDRTTSCQARGILMDPSRCWASSSRGAVRKKGADDRTAGWPRPIAAARGMRI